MEKNIRTEHANKNINNPEWYFINTSSDQHFLCEYTLRCSKQCEFKALFMSWHITNVCQQATWWTAFLKAFWSTQQSLVIVQPPSKIIEWLLTGKGQHDGGGGWLSGPSSEVLACSICIIIELLFRTLISAHYWFFSPPPQQLNQLKLTITHFAFFFPPTPVTFCPPVPSESHNRSFTHYCWLAKARCSEF